MEANSVEACNGEDSPCSSEFEFMSTSNAEALSTGGMKFADELFSDGKLLPLQSNFRHMYHVLDPKSKRGSTEVEQPVKNLTVASPLVPALSPTAPKWTKKLREVFKFTKGQLQNSKDDASSEKQRLPLFTFCFRSRPMRDSEETDDVIRVLSEGVISPDSCNSAGSYASPFKDTTCSKSNAIPPFMNSVESEHMKISGSELSFSSSPSSRRTLPVRRKNVKKHSIFLSRLNVITGMIQFKGRKNASTPAANNLRKRIAMRKPENVRNRTSYNNAGQLDEKAEALPHTQYTKSASKVHGSHYASARVNPLLSIPVGMGPSRSSTMKSRKLNCCSFYF